MKTTKEHIRSPRRLIRSARSASLLCSLSPAPMRRRRSSCSCFAKAEKARASERIKRNKITINSPVGFAVEDAARL